MTSFKSVAVAVEGLGKEYGGRAVLDGIDFAVQAGQVFGLLGPNGAGKTTTVRILATLVAPSRGRAVVAGHDVVAEPHRVREQISLTGQFAAVDDLLTGRETLEMLGQLLHLRRTGARQRAAELLDQFGLGDAADRRVATYSGGMRRRLDLAASLVKRSAVLFLDEPTTGLDPLSRLALWDAVRDLAATGTTILLTTQDLEEADRLADRIALIDAGRLVGLGSPAELKVRVAGGRLDLVLTDAAMFDRALGQLGEGRVVEANPQLRTITARSDGRLPGVSAVLDELAAAGVEVESLSVSSASLEDVFLAFTGHASLAPEGTTHA